MANWWDAAPLDAPPDGGKWWEAAKLDRAPAPSSFVDRMGVVARGMVNNITAGMQGSAPYMEPSQRLGRLAQADFGPTWEGSDERLDPRKHVVLNDPETGAPTVYLRSPDTDEGRISSLGRVMGAGFLAGPVAGPTAAARVPSQTQKLAGDFARAEVDPNLPALTQGQTSGTAANIIKDIPIAGDLTVRPSMLRMQQQTGESADRLAGQYGTSSDPAQAGRIVQEAAQNFKAPTLAGGLSAADARALPTSRLGFGNKTAALYGELDRLVPQSAPIDMSGTKAALAGLADKFPSNPKFGATFQNQLFSRQLEALKSGQPLTYAEAKLARAYVGEQLGKPTIAGEISQSDWRRLYAGLSEDMKAFAEGQGPEAAKAFHDANRYFSAGMKRAENALQPVASAQGPERAYYQIIDAASAGRAADIMKGWQLKRSMPAEQWGQVASTWIGRAGKVVDAVSGSESFSPVLFMREYKKLSPQGKDLLFSGKGQAAQRQMLDSLASISEAQAKLGRLNNPSRSGVYGIWAALIGASGLGNAGLAALGVAGATGAGALLSSPRFARWYANAGLNSGTKAWPRHIAELSALAKAEPALAPQYLQLQRYLGEDQGQ